MHVVHIITGLEAGGAEGMLVRLVGALTNHRHTVINLLEGGYFVQPLRNLGSAVIEANIPYSPTAILKFLRLRRKIIELKPDLIQTWMAHANFSAALSAPSGVPVVWNVRQCFSLMNQKYLTSSVIMAASVLSRHPRAIVYNSRHSATDHERLGYCRQRRVLIPNGVDTARFSPDPQAAARLRECLSLSPNVRLIGRVARDDTTKDTPTLLAAFARLCSDHKDIGLVLVGRGMVADNEWLARRVRALGIADRVHLLGERHDVHSITAGLDVAVISSCTEGFPNALCEAMSSAVPVVTTNVGAAAEIIDDPSRVVPIRDPDRMATAIAALVALPEAQRHQIGQQHRKRILDNYTMDIIAGRYSRLWEYVRAGTEARIFMAATG